MKRERDAAKHVEAEALAWANALPYRKIALARKHREGGALRTDSTFSTLCALAVACAGALVFVA